MLKNTPPRAPTPWWLALVALTLPFSVQAKTYFTNSNGGKFGSAVEACKALIGNHPNYTYGDVKKQDNGVYWCFQKAKDGKGDLDYVGYVSEMEEPDPEDGGKDKPDAGQDKPGGGKDGGGKPGGQGKKPACTAEEVRRMVPGPQGELTQALTGQVSDYGCGHCGAESRRLGIRAFTNSHGAIRMDRYGTKGKFPNHFFLRRQGLYIDSAFMQFFNTPQDNAGPIFVGSEAQLRTMLGELLRTCGLSQRCRVPNANSGDQLFEMLYGGAVQVCSGTTLVMRPSGQADWNQCGN